MKKLLVVAAVICVAVFAEAASYEWNGYDVYQCWNDASSENYATGAAYLFIEGVNGVTYENLAKAVSDGSFITGGWASKSANEGSFGTEGNFHGNYNTGADGADYKGVNMYAVILADGYYDNGKLVNIDDRYALVTSAVEAGEQPPLGSALIPFDSLEKSWTPDGWAAQSTSDVPEPTSGLLLLLGVAGLGLKRRRV